MRLRFRLGPFTFGKSGTRLSPWKGGSGVSVPLSKKKKGGTFGKVRIGSISAYFGGVSSKPTKIQSNQAKAGKNQQNIGSDEVAAIEALGSDQQFLNKLINYGVPWRGVQERIKEELPEQLNDRNNIAYRLVPKALDAVFGEQHTAWKTEKRPSKSGEGETTWIVII
jgi:hypothetical protein